MNIEKYVEFCNKYTSYYYCLRYLRIIKYLDMNKLELALNEISDHPQFIEDFRNDKILFYSAVGNFLLYELPKNI